MTVCFPVYDFANPQFIIGMLVSVIVLGTLLLWLPFKKMASKRKFFFIIPFLILLFVALSFNITLFAVHNSCDDIGKPILVYDYDRNITSRADAEAALKEYFLQQYTAFRRLNETAFDADLNTSMSAIEETPSKYYTHFKSTTFVLHEDGRLYEKKYAGP